MHIPGNYVQGLFAYTCNCNNNNIIIIITIIGKLLQLKLGGKPLLLLLDLTERG